MSVCSASQTLYQLSAVKRIHNSTFPAAMNVKLDLKQPIIAVRSDQVDRVALISRPALVIRVCPTEQVAQLVFLYSLLSTSWGQRYTHPDYILLVTNIINLINSRDLIHTHYLYLTVINCADCAQFQDIIPLKILQTPT